MGVAKGFGAPRWRTPTEFIAMKQPEIASKPLTPFFARKVADAALVVRSGVRAGLAESEIKGSAKENARK